MFVVPWTDFKQIITAKGLSVQYFDRDSSYYIWTVDHGVIISCELQKNPSDTTNLTDFENNYKSTANKPIAEQSSPFAAKTFGSKKLYKRETGVQYSLSQGSNDLLFTIPFNWVKMVGVEIINGTALDTVDLLVLDSTSGTYSGVPNKVLNQFGFTVNVAPGLYEEECQYDADLYLNMQIKIVYNSVDAKTVGINFNLNEVK